MHWTKTVVENHSLTNTEEEWFAINWTAKGNAVHLNGTEFNITITKQGAEELLEMLQVFLEDVE